MPRYRAEWVDHEMRSAYITAKDAAEAREKWNEDDFDYEEDSYVETGEGPDIEEVEE